MKPSDSIQAQIHGIGKDLSSALGTNVECIALYGSAAGEEFSPEHSDVNLVIVLKQVNFADLELIGETLAAQTSRELRVATPLVVAASFLTDARDSFPMELSDIARRHRILAGQDILAGISVDRERLREEAEREARGKLLRLRALILHRPEPKAIREGLMGLVSSFIVIERAILDDDATGEALFENVEQAQGMRLASLERLCRIREGSEGWPADAELNSLLQAATQDTETLVRWIDQHEN